MKVHSRLSIGSARLPIALILLLAFLGSPSFVNSSAQAQTERNTAAQLSQAWSSNGLGITQRVSVSSNGAQSNGSSGFFWAYISDNGRYVAFASDASNLVPDDTNNATDFFVFDRQTSQIERVSVGSGGVQGNNGSVNSVAISNDGRFVIFHSRASNLVPNDLNGHDDVFVRDRQTGQTELVSVSSDGTQGNCVSGFSYASISDDGRYAVFYSCASNLVPADTNGKNDVFVHDRQTGQTSRVSVASDGAQGNDHSMDGIISADGRYVVFSSFATNLDPNGRSGVFIHDLDTGQTDFVTPGRPTGISADGRFIVFDSAASSVVPDDTNGKNDVFVYDRQTGLIERVSIGANGSQGNGDSYYGSVSDDGRYVVFVSNASNLVAGDTNSQYDAFVHDRQTHQTSLVSIASDGRPANGSSFGGRPPTISSDGRLVAFVSDATNLVVADTNGKSDVFVYDRGAVHVISDASVKYSKSLSSGWETLAFDDSAWPTVVAPSAGLCNPSLAGYFPGSLSMPVWGNGPQSSNETIYLRKTFNILNPLSAFIQLYVDDDFDLYVNGALVRSEADGIVTYAQDDVSSRVHEGLNSVAIKARNVTASCGWVNFDLAISADSAYSISGHIADAANASVAGVTISDGNGHSTATDANGNYVLNGLPAGTYTLTPAKDMYTFSPVSRTVNVPPNAPGQDFVALPPACYSLTVSTSAGGTVSSLTLPNCSGGLYVADTIVKLKAEPNDSGYEFAGWSGDISDSSSNANVRMSENKTVIANFMSAQQSQKQVVILVHGWHGLSSGSSCHKSDGTPNITPYEVGPNPDPTFGVFPGLLAADGFEVWIAHLQTTWANTPLVEKNAECLKEQIGQVKGNRQVILIAHSMGGLVSRAYIESDIYARDVQQLITLGTPHTGLRYVSSAIDISIFLSPTGMLSTCLTEQAVCEFSMTAMQRFNEDRHNFRARNLDGRYVPYTFIGGDLI